MAGRFDGLKTIVTGGNTGIGRAVARAYAREGADVTIAWFDRPADAEATVREIVRAGRQLIAVRTDVTDERDVAALFAAHVRRFGRLDVLVNNAGIQKSPPIDRTSLADWERMMAVHLRGAFLCSRAATRAMKRRRAGRIVNVCSQLGYVGRGDYTAWSAAKAGLIGFMRAREGACPLRDSGKRRGAWPRRHGLRSPARQGEEGSCRGTAAQAPRHAGGHDAEFRVPRLGGVPLLLRPVPAPQRRRDHAVTGEPAPHRP
jgi:NAD(P)-dependent dehydrogenase (short-subunit alcohol dehydrogenase family)